MRAWCAAALAAAVLTTVSPGAAVAAVQHEPPCAPVAAALDRSGRAAGCLELALRLAQAPALGGKARLEVEVRTTEGRTSARVEVKLPAGLEWVSAPAGLRVETTPSALPVDRGRAHQAAGEVRVARSRPLRLSGVVRAVAEGAAEIRASVVGAAGRSSGAVFLTVGERASTFGIPVAETTPVAPAAAATRAHPHLAHKPAGPATAEAGNACATGSWGYLDHAGRSRVSANTTVQAWDADAAGGHDLLATGLTDAHGRYRLCFDNADSEGGGQDLYLRFSTENRHWVIRHTDTKRAFRFDTAVRRDIATGATVDFGAQQPGRPELMRGVEAFDTMNTGWNWTPGDCWDARDRTCRQGLLNWAPDSTDGTYYDTGTDDVHLAAEDPDANVLVLHEFGHAIMDDVYEDAFPPVTGCDPHYIHRRSSPSCAWTEGFATWYGVAILGDPTFRWPDGRARDVEGSTWGTPEWDNGEETEGRVLGALIDLSDRANEPGDTCAEDPRGPLWTTFLDHVSGTFAEFWSQRAAGGFDVGPNVLNCLHHNTIDYRI